MKKIKGFFISVLAGLILMAPMYWIMFLSFDAAETDPNWFRFWRRRKALKKKEEETDNEPEDWVEDLD